MIEKIDEFLNKLPKEVLIKYITKTLMYQRRNVIKELMLMALEIELEKLKQQKDDLLNKVLNKEEKIKITDYESFME